MKKMGLGTGELTDTEEQDEGVANDLTNSVESYSGSGNYLGVAGSSIILVLPETRGGTGVLVLAEVLNCLPNLTAPAACASQGAAEILEVRSNPRQAALVQELAWHLMANIK